MTGGSGRALVFALAVLLACGCRPEPEASAIGASVREATITAEVRSRILGTEELGRLPLQVEARGGTVFVRGGVRDAAQADALRAIAARVRGVERVDLDVRLFPSPKTPAPAKPARARRAAPAEPEEPLPPVDEAG